MRKNIEENQQLPQILEKVKEVYNIMKGNNISDVELNIDGYNIKIKRFTKNFYDKKDILKDNMHLINVQTQQNNEGVAQKDAVGEEIVSPISGTFYRSPSPGAPPFVNEGDIVSAGSDLCIIEAMKVMNRIKAEKKCKILKILCENGTVVSSGTKLFLIEPL